ncbi:hypothetical protein K439DRAFT_1618917 [Ramaria rubella]|nr:hypothetical protein K439DRAFT_1618917 [Ramaria rubella]
MSNLAPNSWRILPIIIIFSILLFTQNQGINVLALPLALFAWLGHADHRLITVLNNVGFCVSYWMVEWLKKIISDNAIQLAWLMNKNTMLNITNAAIIGQLDVSPTALDLQKMLDLRGKCAGAKGEDIEITPIDSDHMEKAMTAIVAQILTAYSLNSSSWPDYAETRRRSAALMPFTRPLPPCKTETFPFGVFDVNEGSKKGVVEMMEALQQKSKLTQEQWASKVRINEGDWLTANNLRSAQREQFDNISPMEQLLYLKELSAKWHFALNYLHFLVKVHFGNAIDDPGSLASHKGLLGHMWDVNKPNYAAATSLVHHSLIARILNIVMQINGFQNYSELAKWKPSFFEVHKAALQIVKEFATSSAAGKVKEANDDWLSHSIYFIQDALLFLIFEQYVSFADAGGILRVYKFWVYSFRGARMWNYAWECLEVILLWKYELPPELRDTMEKAWFVNRWGLPGHWILLDLYLEHLNYWVKQGYIAQGSGVMVDYMAKAGSACVEAFRDITHKVVQFIGNKDISCRHKEAKFHLDVPMLVENMPKKIFTYFPTHVASPQQTPANES